MNDLSLNCNVCLSQSVFVIPVKEDRHIQMLLGVLLCFRHVMPHLATQEVKELGLKGSFGVTKKEEEGGVTSEQLQQVCGLLISCSRNENRFEVGGH